VIDLHLHILPGLDDGPADMAESVEMARCCVHDGIHTVVATPHMLSGAYNVTKGDILAGVRAFSDQLRDRNIPLGILPGADVHALGDLADRLRAGEVLTVADGGKYLLVEFNHDGLPPRAAEVLFAVHLSGVVPIITHPERNTAFQDDPDQMLSLVRAGNLVQVTASSFTGAFGRRAEQCARNLLLRRMVHLVASDAHSLKGRPPGLSSARKVVACMTDERETRDIFEANPAAIIAGKSVIVPEPLVRVPRRRWSIAGLWR